MSTEVDNALTVIADIQSLLPKLEVAVDTVISLETAFQSLAGISAVSYTHLRAHETV